MKEGGKENGVRAIETGTERCRNKGRLKYSARRKMGRERRNKEKRERNTQTDRDRDNETDRRTGTHRKETDRQTDRQTDRPTD